MKARWVILLLAVSLVTGCGASSRGGGTTTVQSATSVTVQTTPVRAEQRVQVDLCGGAAGGAGSMIVAPPSCPGLTLHPAGVTRSGRALGMALLAVHARPGAALFVDGAFRGEAPLTAVGVEAGPRDITLRNEALGYECTVRLRAIPGERYALQLDLGG